MLTTRKKPLYVQMNSILHPEAFSSKCFKEALEYEAKPGDVFICTYPKCGTTWMQNIVMYIFRKGRKLEEFTDFLKFCPFIDMIGNEGIDKMPRPGALKTHLPFNYMPYSPEAKYIFVARNPKDCCVSFYHHAKSKPGMGFWDGTFDDFFECFMAGEVEYNDYFDHMLSWYPHRNDSNVFYTVYEDMKKDTKSVVMKLAKFLGQEYLDAIERDEAVLDNILLYSGFAYMKKNLSDVYKKARNEKVLMDDYSGLKRMADFTASLDLPQKLPEEEFVRKGAIGDWKNYFSENQSARLNKKFVNKFSGTEIMKWFPDE